MPGPRSIKTSRISRMAFEANRVVSPGLLGKIETFKMAKPLELPMSDGLVLDAVWVKDLASTQAGLFANFAAVGSRPAEIKVPWYLLDNAETALSFAHGSRSVGKPGGVRGQTVNEKGALKMSEGGNDQSDLVSDRDWFEEHFAHRGAVTEYLWAMVDQGFMKAAQEIFDQIFFPPLGEFNKVLIMGAKGDRELMIRIIEKYPGVNIVPVDTSPINVKFDLPPNPGVNIDFVLDKVSVADAFKDWLVLPFGGIYGMFPNHYSAGEYAKGIIQGLSEDGHAFIVSESGFVAENLRVIFEKEGLDVTVLGISQALLPPTQYLRPLESTEVEPTESAFLVSVRRPRGK